jgi:hypothetical protein
MSAPSRGNRFRAARNGAGFIVDLAALALVELS